MSNFLKHITIKFLQSAIEILFLFPILLFLTASEFPESWVLPIISGLSVYYLTGILIGYFLKDKTNALYVIISFIIGLIVSFALSLFYSFSIIYICMVTFSTFRGIRINSSNWVKQSPVPVFTMLFALYLIFNALFFMSNTLYHHIGLLNKAGLVMIVVFLSICSFDQLKAAFFKSGNKIYIPATILKFNLASLIAALALIIAFAKLKLWTSLLEIIKLAVSSFLVNKNWKKTPPIEGVGGGIPMGHDSLLIILFKIVMVVIIIGLIVFAVCAIFRRVVKMILELYGKSKNNVTKENKLGYVDEKETLLKSSSRRWPNIKNIFKIFNKKGLSWKDIVTNRDKVRFIYRQKVWSFIKKGYEFKNILTPSELGKEVEELYKEDVSHLTSAYNKARYSNESVGINEVEMLVKKFGNKSYMTSK
ncbi:hypothetical protein [Pseudobacteroides cellulosolvens]|nr:hypothetical protein [Pseudobacteroides cellulosolvens]